MQTYSTRDCLEGEIYLAGERVAPGIYRQIGSTREVCLDREEALPASLDGRVACYQRIEHTWEQMCRRQQAAQRRAQSR